MFISAKGIRIFISVLILFFICAYDCFSQNNFEQINSKSLLNNLQQGDSVIYYQCHLEEGTQSLVSASGQTITGKAQPYTITEKYVIIKKQEQFFVRYLTSSMTIFPNKKFSGLKIREKDYWQFKQDSTFFLSDIGLKVLLSLENKGREAVEYDYPITKYTTNQIIIKRKKDFKQLVIEKPYIISKLIFR